MERIKCEKMDKIIANMELAEQIELRDNPPKAVFKCDKCNKTFKYRSRLVAHQKRKRPCDFILEIKDTEKTEKAKAENRICKYCNRIFTSIKYLKAHIKKNCPIAPNEKNGNKGMEILYKHLLDNPGVKNIIIDNSINDNSVTNNIYDDSVTNNINDDSVTNNINDNSVTNNINDDSVTNNINDNSVTPITPITPITPFTFEVGHNKPYSNGGKLEINNLLPICSTCNKSIDEFSKIATIKNNPCCNIL